MFRLTILTTLLLGLLLPAVPAVAQTKGKKYALLIGVSTYKHASLPPLKYTQNDIDGLADLLRKDTAGFASVRVLSTQAGKKDARDAPTAANITQALDELVAGKGRHDSVLVALAGHGAQLLVDDPDGKGPQKAFTFFCPSDADLVGVSYSTGRSKTLVNMNDLFAALEKCGAGTKLALIDACRNELKAESATRSLDPDQVKVPHGVGAMFSCGPGERAWETAKLKHGVFFHYVLEGLRGKARNEDNEVTWNRLADYVQTQVTREVPKVIGKGAKQRPHNMTNNVGESPVLVRALAGADSDDKTKKEKATVRGPARPAGESEQLFLKALALYEGRGEGHDLTEAARLFRRSADKGHDLARAALAFVLLTGGPGVKTDAAEAQKLAKQALEGVRGLAEKGDPEAQLALGRMYASALGVARDDGEAVAWFQKAADQGHAEAQGHLAGMYLAGKGVNHSPAKAYELLQKAAAAKNVWAQFQLAILLENGEGTAANAAEAFKWYRSAADQQHVPAMCFVGVLYEKGKGVARDEKEAARWYKKAAEKDHATAQLNLGLCYAAGVGVERNEDAAVQWFKRAAAQKHPLAMVELGVILSRGRGVPKNETEAFGWFTRAAKLNSAAGEYHVGVAYETGKGVSRDEKEALAWYRKAASKNEPRAQASLGRFYAEGRGGLKKDARVALTWFEKAAAVNNAEAKAWLKKLKG